MNTGSRPIKGPVRIAAALLALTSGLLGILIGGGGILRGDLWGVVFGLISLGFGIVLLRAMVARWSPAGSKIPWRGLLVAASWIVWPQFYFVGYLLFNLVFSTRHGSDPSVLADPPEGLLGVLFFLGFPAVPALITYRWVKGRARSRADAV